MSQTDLRAFLRNPGFGAALASAWDAAAGAYRNLDREDRASPGIQQYLLLYHTYLALDGGGGDDAVFDKELHGSRAISLARHLAGCVTDGGLIREPDGVVGDHPAHACHVLDGLATFVHYAPGLTDASSDLGDAVAGARAAVLRIVEHHPVVRLPDGVAGRTQQMRFELRAYYWAWRITGEERFKAACLRLWENGLHAYRNPVAFSGALAQPSLHPDYTWNYTCTSGTTTEYATNTHTPVYYCTEPQGFAFVYAHGLKDGLFARDPAWEEFCRNYFLGLPRNLSRAGHTASDLDGYGIHRAWYSGCLVESVPLEAAGAADIAGLSPQMRGAFRWYVGRYVDFVRRSPRFAETGLPEHCPYGHDITLEKQFPALIGARFYAQLARGLHEYGLAGVRSIEPPARLDYAWWHNWARVSTPVYETSFVGTTSLCGTPVARHYGDPHLGCLHGGAPLATLFVGNELLYATSNDPAGLWHVELTDVNGETQRSVASSFADETALALRTTDGRLLTRDSFEDYAEPFSDVIDHGAAEVAWSKNLRAKQVRFFVRNTYGRDSLSLDWGASFPRGHYIRTATFVLAVPADLRPEILLGEDWAPLVAAGSRAGWPRALRWRRGASLVEVACERPAPAPGEGSFEVRALPVAPGRPGGENCFCPYALLQLRLEWRVTPAANRARLRQTFRFEATATPAAPKPD